MPGSVFHALHRLWTRAERRDEYFGTLVNAWLAQGGTAVGIKAGRQYVDVGTINGYRAAVHVLESGNPHSTATISSEERRESEPVIATRD